MSKFEMIFDVDDKAMWEPYEKFILPNIEADSYMFMGIARQDNTDIYLYKDSITRDYINIDKEGNRYRYYCGDQTSCNGKCGEEKVCESYYKIIA